MTMIKRCLVTGGLGFIGSHVVDLLIKNQHEVWVIDDLSTGSFDNANANAKYEIHSIGESDFLDQLLAKIKPHWVFHLAALPRIQPSFDDPILHDEVNVHATIKLLLSLKSIPIEAFVFSSSSAVYGNPDELPTSESASINPLSPYALQKYAAERYVHILGDRHNIPVVSLRYFNPYGPRSFNPKNPFNAYTSVVGIFRNQLNEGKAMTITGNGLQERDFIHVFDVANANLIVAEQINTTRMQVYNVGSGQCMSILDLSKKFDAPAVFIPERKGEANITLAKVDKLKQTGWEPLVSIENAIERKII